MVDARDLKSLERKLVPVRVRPRAPFQILNSYLLIKVNVLNLYALHLKMLAIMQELKTLDFMTLDILLLLD